jgi:putative membrane protein
VAEPEPGHVPAGGTHVGRYQPGRYSVRTPSTANPVDTPGCGSLPSAADGILPRMGRVLLIGALVGWGVNIVALIVVDWLFDSVEIGRWGSLLLAAAVLGLANTIVKPVLALLTLPLILATLGLFYFVLNILMLALAEWVAPDFTIDGFWTYVGATIVVWLVNWVLHSLLGSLRDDHAVAA